MTNQEFLKKVAELADKCETECGNSCVVSVSVSFPKSGDGEWVWDGEVMTYGVWES